MGHQPHFLLVTFPAQGHINPSLQLAKRLIRAGASLTFVTSVSAQRRMSRTPPVEGLNFATFSDGYDDGFNVNGDTTHYLSELRRAGTKAIEEIVVSSANDGCPVTCILYTTMLPWAAEVARSLHVPQVLVWIQPATVFDIYYYYFNGYGEVIRANYSDPSWSIKFPGLPLLMTSRDLPSFMNPRDTNDFALPSIKEQLDVLEEESNPKILVNTFDALEPEALSSIQKLNLIGVGPFIPSAFLDGKDPTDTSFGGDLFKQSKGYTEWLASNPRSSVIYISFGSISAMSKLQNEEIAKALLEIQRPFLWVIREREDREKKEDDEISWREELEKQGMIVPWCSQIEVLSHVSLGCFVTHCGWNSSLESLVSGVPVVSFPQWTDQPTNANLIEDYWKTGVRLSVNEEGTVDSDEIKKSLEIVMADGERGNELRSNAKKWKHLAAAAAKEGGSSYNNLKAFIKQFAEGN